MPVQASSRADDSVPSEMSLENALKLLGVSEGASFDEILRAKNSILATCSDDKTIAQVILLIVAFECRSFIDFENFGVWCYAFDVNLIVLCLNFDIFCTVSYFDEWNLVDEYQYVALYNRFSYSLAYFNYCVL